MIELRRLTQFEPIANALQSVFIQSTNYLKRINGVGTQSNDAQSTFNALPDGYSKDAKYLIGVFQGDRLIGAIDLIRGFPEPSTAMLGLLLISETHHGQGFGKKSYSLLEKTIREWPEVKKVRIGVVATNDSVLPFWKKFGFIETGERKPYQSGPVISENIVLEKML